MSIQFAFFSVPMGNPLDVGEDLNRLLKSVRVLTVHREFVSDGGNSVWAFAVEYLSGTMDQKKGRPGKGRVDYREVLFVPTQSVGTRGCAAAWEQQYA